MNLKEIRFFERWERLDALTVVAWLFLFLIAAVISSGFFFLALRPIFDPDFCHYVRTPRARKSCEPGSMFEAFTIGSVFTYFTLKLALGSCVEVLFRPLARRPLSSILRMFLLFKRVRLDKVAVNGSVDLRFASLHGNYQTYQAFTLKIKNLQRLTFYQGDYIDISPSSIFREGALLEFSYLADSTGLDYARARVRCEYEGQVFHGELELEADSYELRLLPRSVLENRQ